MKCTTEEIEPGTAILLTLPRPDGSTSEHLGEYVGCSIHEICVVKHSWVAETGRRHLFLAGTPDDAYEVECSMPEAITRLPRWQAMIQDWLHPLPTESK